MNRSSLSLSQVALLIPAFSFLYVVHLNLASIPTNLFEVALYVLAIAAFVIHPEWRSLRNSEVRVLGYVVLVCLIGVVISPEKREALGILKGWVIPALLAYWMITRSLKDHSPELLLRGMKAQGILIGVVAILQHLPAVVGLWGVRFPDTMHYLEGGRAVSVFNSPNAAAMILTPALLILLAQTANVSSRLKPLPATRGAVLRAEEETSTVRSSGSFISLAVTHGIFTKTRQTNWLGGVLNLLGVLVVMLGLFATGSRGGVVAAVVSILVFWLWNIRKNVAYALAGVALLIMNPLTLTYLGMRNPDHLDLRVPIWHKTWDLLMVHPIFGFGLQSFHTVFAVFTLHQTNYDEFISPYAVHPHNIFLYTWFLFGLLGLLGLVYALGKVFYHSYRTSSLVSRLGACLVLVFVIQGMVDNTIWKNDLVIWVTAAFILASSRKEPSEVE